MGVTASDFSKEYMIFHISPHDSPTEPTQLKEREGDAMPYCASIELLNLLLQNLYSQVVAYESKHTTWLLHPKMSCIARGSRSPSHGLGPRRLYSR